MKTSEHLTRYWFIFSIAFVLLTPIAIGIGLYLKSMPIFQDTSIWQHIFSSDWKPGSGKFGLWSYLLSSIYITLGAIIFTTPLCIFTSIFLTQFEGKKIIRIMQPVSDILAGIPSVIYGVWGIIMIVPFVSDVGRDIFGYETSGYSMLSGIIVLSVMLIPFQLNIMLEVIRNIPRDLTEASLSLGANRWETSKKVILRKALPGIISAIGLSVSRAFGETMAVLMVVGNVSQVPDNIFLPAYPIPALIANNYGEMMSIPLYDAALMLAAFLLFVLVFVFNLFSRAIIFKLS